MYIWKYTHTHYIDGAVSVPWVPCNKTIVGQSEGL